MLYEIIENQKDTLYPEDYEIPSYITDNLKFPLYEWQKTALENFLINERTRTIKAKKGAVLPPNHLMFNMATGSGKTLIMAALILYYYKQGYRNFIFFVNQNAILGKTQANFINKNHNKYLFKENVVIDGVPLNFKEVEMFSNFCGAETIQIKFTTIQKLHNDIYKENENSLLLSDLQKRDIVLIGDEAHHLNAATLKKNPALSASFASEANGTFSDISFLGELKDSSKDEDVERSWETTVCHHILNKGGKSAGQNKNVLLEFTATIPETEAAQKKYEDKIITKFALKEFVEAGCTKHIRLVRSNLEVKERILQALLLNWYRYSIAVRHGIANFKPVILFRSKTIDESKSDYQKFLDLCKNVNASDFDFVKKISSAQKTNSFASGADEISDAYNLDGKIFERINAYMSKNNFSCDTVAQFIKENFGERNVIITNSRSNKTKKEKTDSETDRLLNSLEDSANHIRAIFTVQRLTEGWDVLNLYDIVRLYSGRDTDFKNKKAGSSTTSEVQLIGRGVRYFPFEYEGKEKSCRKFDNDLQNELRILEEFYFHSDDDVKYISELSQELKRTGIISDTRTQKTFRLKETSRKELEKLCLFVNERKENPERRLRTLPDDFKNIPPFEYDLKTSLYSNICSVNFQGDDEDLSVADSQNIFTETFAFADFIDDYRNIYTKAVHVLNTNPASYFSFENLRQKFNICTMEDFFNFIKDIKITLKRDADFSDIPNKEFLKMFEEFFLYCKQNLESYDNPFVGGDFKLVPFSECFAAEKEKLINIDEKNPETLKNNILEKEICSQECKWYALDNFWGTEEEWNLVQFVKESLGNLYKKYDRISLLRNEEVYKIFAFKDGQGFQPDFLLLLRGKNDENAYFQVFIEPKGKHLAEKDSWKEEFLEEISRRYGFSKPVRKETEKYCLFGLPFFNAGDKTMKEKFRERFEEIV